MNIVIAVNDRNKDKFNSLLKELDGQNVQVFVGIEEKNAQCIAEFNESENIYISKFQDGCKKESMINGLQKYVQPGATLVLRKPITLEEVQLFLGCNRDVATCKVQRSKIKAFFFGLWQVVLKFFLGVREYEGETSAVYINNDISSVVGESGNLSFSTRVNRWRGIEQTTIEVKGQPAEKETDKKPIIKYSIIAITSILLAIIVTTVLCLTVNVGIVIGLLIVCLDVICLAISIMTIIIAVFNSRIGKKNPEEAVESDK